jgi:hypothetical protein
VVRRTGAKAVARTYVGAVRASLATGRPVVVHEISVKSELSITGRYSAEVRPSKGSFGRTCPESSAQVSTVQFVGTGRSL